MSHHIEVHSQELRVPYGGLLKGRLMVALPSRNRPRTTSQGDWCANVVNQSLALGELHLAIPESFWLSESKQGEKYSDFQSNIPQHIVVHDTFGEFGGDVHLSPLSGLRAIVDLLAVGESVLVVSNSKVISGFVPALLGHIIDPDCHFEKLIWPIQHGEGYALTVAQIAYIAGLYDARAIRDSRLERVYEG